MIRRFAADNGKLRLVDPASETDQDVVWFDLFAPTEQEEALLERPLGVDIPTREDMEEIEISSRLYYEDGAAFMTAVLPAKTDADDPHMAPVTFVLTGDLLITVRYHEPQAFRTFPQRAEKVSMGCEGGESVLVALMDVIVDRLADVLERAGRDIERISRDIFQTPDGSRGKSRDFQSILEDLGRKADLNSKIRHSLGTLERLFGFLTQFTMQKRSNRDIRARIKTLTRDARSLLDHASFLSQKTTFLLDATLGMVNIEQNATIKIFSVAAVVFLPPTLIASMYGMNFAHIPELEWLLGYPFAIGLMIASAVLPYLYFKRRGWL